MSAFCSFHKNREEDKVVPPSPVRLQSPVHLPWFMVGELGSPSQETKKVLPTSAVLGSGNIEVLVAEPGVEPGEDTEDEGESSEYARGPVDDYNYMIELIHAEDTEEKIEDSQSASVQTRLASSHESRKAPGRSQMDSFEVCLQVDEAVEHARRSAWLEESIGTPVVQSVSAPRVRPRAPDSRDDPSASGPSRLRSPSSDSVSEPRSKKPCMRSCDYRKCFRVP